MSYDLADRKSSDDGELRQDAESDERRENRRLADAWNVIKPNFLGFRKALPPGESYSAPVAPPEDPIMFCPWSITGRLVDRFGRVRGNRSDHVGEQADFRKPSIFSGAELAPRERADDSEGSLAVLIMIAFMGLISLFALVVIISELFF
jgi:hypothetical protein